MSFFVLRNPSAYQTDDHAVTDATPVDPVHVGEAIRCSDCGNNLSMLPWLPPFRVVLEPWTCAYGDITWAIGNELLLSERFVDLFQESGLTGLQVLGHAEIVRVTPRGGARPQGTPPQYLCARPVLSNTKIDLEASGVEMQGPVTCDTCRSGVLLRHKRVVVDEGTWTGEDLFYARGLSGLIITSERFAEWFRKNKINSGVLVPAQEFATDFHSSA